SWTVGQALRTRVMWLLLSATIVPAAITNGLSFNQISILTQAGLSPTTAAMTFAVESAVTLPMTLLSGWLADRIGPRYVLAFGQVALLLTLICLTFTASLEMAILFGVLRGITTGSWVLGTEVIMPVYFGRRYLGSIVGLSFASAFAGAAIGPIPFGVAYDLTGSYQVATIGLAVLPALTTVAALLAKPPARRRLPTRARG
ncbi:MAG: MFS transporter, partial [Chloroflexia bacterium]|nr:MFS transporter [Chloroflexia bacterium]